MGRFREFGQDAAYFGFGDGSEQRRASDAEREDVDWWQHALLIVPVVLAAFVLRQALGFEDDVTGFLVAFGLALLLTPIWARILRALRGAGGDRQTFPCGVWTLAEDHAIYVVQHPGRAGNSVLTLVLDG